MPTHKVTPIALRQDNSRGHDHPLLPLVAVRRDIREEATDKIERLSKVITVLFDSMHESNQLVVEMGDDNIAGVPEDILQRYLHLNLVRIPEALEQIVTFLSEVGTIVRIPQLEGFRESAQRYLENWRVKSNRVSLEAKELVSGPRNLQALYEATSEAIVNLEGMIRQDVFRVWDHTRFLSRLCPRLWQMRESAYNEPERAKVSSDARMEKQKFKLMGELPLIDDSTRSIIHHAINVVDQISKLRDASNALNETVKKFTHDFAPLRVQQEELFSVETRGYLHAVATSHKDKLINSFTRQLLLSYLDPFDLRAGRASPEKWMPQNLRNLCRGITVNDRGELCQSDEKGDPDALVRELALLIDQGCPEIFREGRFNRRLAPVIRAAFPIAKELVASAAEARRVLAEQELLKERARVEALEQSREFLKMVFDENFGSGFTPNSTEAENARSMFLNMYKDTTAFEERQARLQEIGTTLSMRSEYLLGQIEFYLLSMHDLDRWFRQVRQIRSEMLKSSEVSDHVALNDLSNFLPSKVRKF